MIKRKYIGITPRTYLHSKEHLKEVNMGYFEHMGWALKTALFLFVHAFIPGKYTHTASQRLCDQNKYEDSPL